MANLAFKKKYSLKEYTEMEMASEERLEFHDGYVWSMAGASPGHETIVGNAITALNIALRGKSCRSFPSNLRLKVPDYPPYRYPDLSALCGEPIYEEIEGLQMLVNPSLIVEVLSKSTAEFDRGDKFSYYKSIESFTEYLLISQERPNVVHYVKQDEKTWLQREYNDIEETFYLESVDCEISLEEIYMNIEFKPSEKTEASF
ncbi:MAG: Uma2 family endonuclease [Aridibacter sp.]